MINIIVASSENNVIGKDNKLLWRQSADLKRFKELTTGKIVIMGRKTFDSIGKPLPNRRNIVVTRQDIKIQGVETIVPIGAMDGFEFTLNSFKETPVDIFILGGGEIYKQSIKYADKIYLTKIHTDIEGDTYFPELGDEWKIESEERFSKDEKNEYDYSFINYIR